jgi:hypothetical protein
MGMDVYCISSFATVRTNGDVTETEEERTDIRFRACLRHDLRASTARTVTE